jgi:hypothetical protein
MVSPSEQTHLERARRFYEAGGWLPDGGSCTEVPGGAGAYVLRYRLDLGVR